jgi:hypothetical protein
MKTQKKTLLQRRKNQLLSGMAFLISICANIMMFCILAFARTTPSIIHQQDNEPIHIVSLELPVPSNIEKVIQQETIEKAGEILCKI